MKITIEIPDDEFQAVINDVFLNVDLFRYIDYWTTDQRINNKGQPVFKLIESPYEGYPYTILIVDHALAERAALELYSKEPNNDLHDSNSYDNAFQKALFDKVCFK